MIKVAKIWKDRGIFEESIVNNLLQTLTMNEETM